MKRACDRAQRALDRVAVVEPRPSASVILVCDAPHGLETFVVRRHARSPVAPSAYVFPGGTVRPADPEVIEGGSGLGVLSNLRFAMPGS